MTIRPETFQYIQEGLQQRTAICLLDNKEYLVETRLALLAKQNGMQNVDALVERLQVPGSSALWRDVVDAMTTNETSFFRDQTPFEVFETRVIPELVKNDSQSRTIRVWSAAASSGQEAYSIAIIWDEIRKHYPHWGFDILATDISNKMLERGREGAFSDLEVGRGLSEQRLEAHFQRRENRWWINERLKQDVEFRYLNLINAWPTMPKMDVVFIRNVLVYFDNPTKASLFAKVRSILKPNGFLFLGGAETALTLDDHFERVFENGGNCYRLKSE